VAERVNGLATRVVVATLGGGHQRSGPVALPSRLSHRWRFRPRERVVPFLQLADWLAHRYRCPNPKTELVGTHGPD
jgi:hypothetical protein